MKIKQINVKSLFGIYNYRLNFEEIADSHVAIIDAPNGMGKTSILKMIQAAVNADIICLDSIPFKSFELVFSSNDSIKVQKKEIYETVLDLDIFELRNYYAHTMVDLLEEKNSKYCNITVYVNKEEFPVCFQRDMAIMWSRRISPRMMREREAGKPVKISECLPIDSRSEDVFNLETLISALRKVTGNSVVYYIKTNRLYRQNSDDVRDIRYDRRIDKTEAVVSAVELYSDKIKDKIIAKGKQFGDSSQELDRSFPQRVLKTIFDKPKNVDVMDTSSIVEALDELEKERNKLKELGLITSKTDSYVKIPKGKEIPRETRIFLTHYIEDSITKLETYRTFAEQLRLLKNIVNDRNVFSDKTMYFDSEEGIVFISTNGHKIPIDKLSSGEKNNLVLFYELIFECGRDSVILVDEPEISLHVFWQRQFIGELNEICAMKGLQGIVATHSPDIVNYYDEQMIDLVNIHD